MDDHKKGHRNIKINIQKDIKVDPNFCVTKNGADNFYIFCVLKQDSTEKYYKDFIN